MKLESKSCRNGYLVLEILSYSFYVSQILSYNVNIWRNLNHTMRQKILAVNRRVFFCMYGTIALRSSRLFKTGELQICSYSKTTHATLHFSAICECSEFFWSSVARFTTPAFVEYTYRVIHVLRSNLLQQRLSGCN